MVLIKEADPFWQIACDASSQYLAKLPKIPNNSKIQSTLINKEITHNFHKI